MSDKKEQPAKNQKVKQSNMSDFLDPSKCFRNNIGLAVLTHKIDAPILQASVFYFSVMWVHTEASCASIVKHRVLPTVKRRSVSRCDDTTILAQNICVFYGGENCRVVASGPCIIANISNACANACVPILNQHVVGYSYTCSKRCNG
jgi:hypothetical protein